MKDDLISRKAAIGAIVAHEMEEIDEKRKWYNHGLLDAEIEVLDLPIVQSDPKKGEWIKERIGYTFENDDWIKKVYIYQVTCPYCGYEMTMGTNEEVEFRMKRNKFCLNCGADMREGKA